MELDVFEGARERGRSRSSFENGRPFRPIVISARGRAAGLDRSARDRRDAQLSRARLAAAIIAQRRALGVDHTILDPGAVTDAGVFG